MSDERYGIPTQRLADAQALHSRVYRYRIDIAQPGIPDFLDGAHGTELGMVWNPPEQVSLPREITAAQIHQAWVSFVEDGIPLPSWPPYGATRPVQVFDEDSHVEYDPDRRERLAWGDTTWQPGAWFSF
jgi:para-nitrobenzyl esterase